MGRFLSIGVSVVLLAGATWLGFSVYRAYKRKGAVPELVDDETAAVEASADADESAGKDPRG